MRANLPLHMVPSRIVFLDSLPYNKGNKIDREALRQYFLPVRDDSKSEKPRTETEMLLADIWAEILELPDISRDDDFFNLGGDSLSGAIVAARDPCGTRGRVEPWSDRRSSDDCRHSPHSSTSVGAREPPARPHRSRSSRSIDAYVAFSGGSSGTITVNTEWRLRTYAVIASSARSILRSSRSA